MRIVSLCIQRKYTLDINIVNGTDLRVILHTLIVEIHTSRRLHIL